MKVISKILILFLGMVWSASIGTCQTFNKSYGGFDFYDLEEAYDINIGFDEYLHVFYLNQDSDQGTSRVWKSRIDYVTGELIDSTFTQRDSTTLIVQSWNHSDQLSDGGYIVAGYLAELLDNNTSFDNDLGFILRLDANGDSLWLRKFGNENEGNTLFQAKACSDGGFVAVGASDINNANLDVWVVKVSANGDEEWNYRYNTFPGYEDVGKTIVETVDGGFIVGGTTNYLWGSSVNKHLLLKLNSQGIQEGEPLIVGEDWSIARGYAMLDYCADGNFVYTARWTSDSSDNVNLFFAKINSNMEFIWTKDYELTSGNPDTNYASRIRENPDGTFIVVSGGENVDGEDEGIISKLDSEGNLLWHRYYQNGVNYHIINRLFDVVRCPDGGYAACGTTFDWPGGTQYWVLKVDSMGCLIPGCDTLVNVLEQTGVNVVFETFPNPVEDVLNIYIQTKTQNSEGVFTLYDLDGKKMNEFLSHRSDMTYMWNIAHLPSGVYILTYTDEKGNAVSKKIIKG
jgi:Secretion system C-terminal sorting domain